MSDFEAFGRAIDRGLSEAFEQFSSVIASLSDVLNNFATLPHVEASQLKDLARDHKLDVVERNNVRVDRHNGSLRARYHDGSEWQSITTYHVNCRCETEVEQ